MQYMGCMSRDYTCKICGWKKGNTCVRTIFNHRMRVCQSCSELYDYWLQGESIFDHFDENMQVLEQVLKDDDERKNKKAKWYRGEV